MGRPRKSEPLAAVVSLPPKPRMKKRTFELDGDIVVVVTAPEGSMDWEANASSVLISTRGTEHALMERLIRRAPPPPSHAQYTGDPMYTNNLGEHENPTVGTLRDLPPGAEIPGMDGVPDTIARTMANIVADAIGSVKHDDDGSDA